MGVEIALMVLQPLLNAIELFFLALAIGVSIFVVPLLLLQGPRTWEAMVFIWGPERPKRRDAA